MLLFSTFFIIFIYGIEALSISSNPVNPRSVNLNLETSFVIENADGKKSSFEDKIRFILEKLLKLCEPLKQFLNDGDDGEESDSGGEYLQNFFSKLANHGIKYEDDKISDISKFVADEISRLVENNEDFSDKEFQTHVKNNLKKFLSMAPEQIRSKIKKALHDKKVKLKKFIHKLKDFYDERDHEKLKKIIAKAKRLPDARKKIKKIVRDAFNALFYEKYDALDKSSKLLFTKEIRKLLTHADLHTRRNVESPRDVSEMEKEVKTKITFFDSNETSENQAEPKIVLNKNIEIYVKGKKSQEMEK